MKQYVAILVGAAMICGASVASAQHMPLPPPPPEFKSMRFPAPAAKYEKVVQWYLGLIRQIPSRFHATQADTDVVILVLKDCASRVESDGIVTEGESKYCERVTLAKVHELMVPYMMEQQGNGSGNAGH